MKTIAWCAQLSRKRSIWLTIMIICALLLTFAHLILQQWLYMSPCEQCVYIRFSLVVILLAAGIVCLFPKSLTIKSIGCLTGLTASYYGMRCSLLLQRIHDALRSDDINTLFGLDDCSMKPRFPLDLPLQDWFPTWFMPTGECGIDLPVVPSGAMLGGLQQHLIKTYESEVVPDSWTKNWGPSLWDKNGRVQSKLGSGGFLSFMRLAPAVAC